MFGSNLYNALHTMYFMVLLISVILRLSICLMSSNQLLKGLQCMTVFDCFTLILLFRVVHTLSSNFREATSIVRASLRLPIDPKHVLVKVIYAGVNASDVSQTSFLYIINEYCCSLIYTDTHAHQIVFSLLPNTLCICKF